MEKLSDDTCRSPKHISLTTSRKLKRMQLCAMLLLVTQRLTCALGDMIDETYPVVVD